MRQPGAQLLAILLLAVCLVTMPGCLARRRVITRKGAKPSQTLLTADSKTLVERIQKEYEQIQNFSATVDMVPALGSAEKSKITEYKDVRGYILFSKPADIRIIGLYPVVRNKAFDMVSNGKDFKVFIPARNRFIVGQNDLVQPSANKLENLRPQHFLEALLVRPPAEGEVALLQNFTDEENAAYILHVVRRTKDNQLELARDIWFDRIKLNLVRQMVFDRSGDILTDARYSDWQTYDNVPFPKHIEINRPKDEYGVVLTVVKMDIDKGVTPDKFALEQPEGSTLQVLGQHPTPATSAERAMPSEKKTR